MRRPESKFVALLGLSFDAKAVEIIVESAFKDYSSRVARFADIKEKSMEEISALDMLGPRVRDGIAHLSGIITPPPFLAKAIVDFEKGLDEGTPMDPMELLMMVLQARRNYDVAQEGAEDEVPEYGLGCCEQLIRWLLSVSKGLIEKTELKIDIDDEETQTYQVKCHDEWIIPPIMGTSAESLPSKTNSKSFSLRVSK
jgi:hypothetical protein